MKRNSSIELYRCLLMFGIVLLHCAGCGEARAPWLGNMLKFCVTGFVFISGYYGIKFSWSKIGKMYALGAYCAILGAVVQACFGGENHGLVYESWLNMRRLWFLHAYAVLMAFAPILNLAFERKGRELALLLFPVVALVFGWSYCYEIGHLRPYVLPTVGLGSHTPLTLIGIYVAARWIHVSGVEERISSICFTFIVALLPIAAVGLAPYNSIFALILAMLTFLIFKRHVKCGEWASRIAPSMLSVYFLHSTGAGLAVIHNYVRSSGGWGGQKYLEISLCAVALFVVCIAIDLIRRSILMIVSIYKIKKCK